MALVVKVSTHALDRLLERYPETQSFDRTTLHQLILTEVAGAVQEQRMATKIPRWAHDTTYYRGRMKRNNGAEHSRTARFIWNPEHTRVYLIDRSRDEITVITTIKPPA